jgi:glucosamine--fructose-6-phosphate aminotransferase (isomerizing)
MCGIIAYVGEHDSKKFILSGLKLLQNRGYDSAGISFIQENKIETIKFASSDTNNAIFLLESEIDKYTDGKKSCLAIGHTRWATHGKKSIINTHPHQDNKNRIALVHNGIIENYLELKNQLINEGYFFRSDTDSEVIAVLIGKHLDKGESMESAIQRTLDSLEGNWALAIIHKDYDCLWVSRNGLPLLIGINENLVMIASENIAFSGNIATYKTLGDNDLVCIKMIDNKISLSENADKYPIEEIDTQSHVHSLDEYPHWLIKEIFEQPIAIQRALKQGKRFQDETRIRMPELDGHKSPLLEVDHLILLGCGTSYHAGLWCLDIFKTLDIFDTVSIFDGAEFNRLDIPKKGKSIAILLSQSGETKDLYDCIPCLKQNNIISIGVLNVVDSLISRDMDYNVYVEAGREISVASTKSFTNQCVVLSTIAIWFSQEKETCIEKRKYLISDLRRLSTDFQSSLVEKNIEKIKSLVCKFKPSETVFLLGKRNSYAIALESALKLKEVSYIQAEGYNSSALKHGPFALIRPELPVILFDINSEYKTLHKNVYQELKAREANVICVCDDGSGDINIEKNKTFGGLIANSYMQLLCYYIAIDIGHNPDFPKNLAKVVTVL